MTRLEYLSQFSNAVLSPELNCDPNNMLRARSAGRAMFETLAIPQVSRDEKEFRKMWCKEQLMSIVECGANYEHLNAEQKTSLFMICNKIARAVNGDPQYFDNYRDIAGYATLAERACDVVRGAND